MQKRIKQRKPLKTALLNFLKESNDEEELGLDKIDDEWKEPKKVRRLIKLYDKMLKNQNKRTKVSSRQKVHLTIQLPQREFFYHLISAL